MIDKMSQTDKLFYWTYRKKRQQWTPDVFEHNLSNISTYISHHDMWLYDRYIC